MCIEASGEQEGIHNTLPWGNQGVGYLAIVGKMVEKSSVLQKKTVQQVGRSLFYYCKWNPLALFLLHST